MATKSLQWKWVDVGWRDKKASNKYIKPNPAEGEEEVRLTSSFCRFPLLSMEF